MKHATINRKCTDIFCLLIFISFWSFFVLMTMYSYKNGDLNNILVTYDADNKQCGLKERKDYPFLFINENFYGLNKNKAVCIKNCPNGEGESIDCFENSKLKCSELKAYKTIGFVNTICLPFENKKLDFTNLNDFVNIENINSYYHDIKDFWKIILGSILISFFVGLVYTVFVEFLAYYIIYIFFILSLISSVFLGYLSFIKLDDNNKIKKDYNIEFPINFKNPKYYKYVAYGLWGISFIIIIIFFFFRKALNRAITVVEITSDFITDVSTALFVPFLIFVFYWIFIGSWLFSFAYLFSMGEVKQIKDSIFGTIERNKFFEIVCYYFVFGFFWGLSFLNHLNSFLIIFCAIEWSLNTERFKFSFPLIKGLIQGIFFHLGTIAFASFVLAVIWILEIIVLVINKLFKSENQNFIQRFFLAIFSYILYLFEKFIKMLNKVAFCDTFLDSTSFCAAAKSSFFIMFDHLAEFSILSFLVSLFNILASIFISTFTVLVSYYLIKNYYKTEITGFEDIKFVLLIIGILAYTMSYLFISVYENASVAILYTSIKGDILDIEMKEEVDLLFDLRPKKYILLEKDK